MKSFFRIVSSVCLVVLPSAGHAQIFTCKNSAGRTISSDRPSPECGGSSIREMSREGIVRREIPAALSPEQKRQKQLEEEKRKADMAAAEERRKFDQMLMVRYPTEGHIDIIRKRALSGLQEKINVSNNAIATASRQQKEILAGAVPDKKKELSAAARAKLDVAEQTIKSERANIASYEAEIDNANLRFDAALKRYREISGTSGATAGTVPVKNQ